MKKKIIILVSIGIISTIFVYAANVKKEISKTAIVTLNENGFEPQILTVSRGDTIVFKTTKGQPFWPASDLHPSHTIYSEFDPKMPVEASSVWSFKFEKNGSWKYHDHLFPLYRGTIIVK